MRLLLLSILIWPLLAFSQHESKIKEIFDHQLTQSSVYENLRYLCKEIGPRLSGSPQAAAAVNFTYQLMQDYGFDTVYLEPVMVPRWIRGQKEVVKITNSNIHGTVTLDALALGNSVGTGPDGIVAEIIEVNGLDDLKEKVNDIEGKIVFFNKPMDPTIMDTFRAYGGAVRQRTDGASEAARYGAKAVLVRSITNRIDDVPHTGVVVYKPLIHQIPAVAISTLDAEFLSELLADQDDLSVFIQTTSMMQDEVQSYNVVGELKGTELPDEIITVGGHLDSWDVGEGAHDDGGGCMMSIEVARTFKALNYQPKRTIRIVMFMNEENGLRGGKRHAELVAEKNEQVIVALEADSGSFGPKGFSSTGPDNQQQKLMSWASYFKPYHIWDFGRPGGGADIGPLAKTGTFLIGMNPNPHKYFNYHHTAADVFETVDKRELELGAAAMTALVYLIDQEGLD